MTPLDELLGNSPGIIAVRETAKRLLQRQSDRGRLPPVLIEGETGVGKGVLARALHRAGPRADGPFVDVNCAAIPETLLEAQFFGYERGAFTDARHAKAGLFQAASHGTLFLDEVGLLPEALQAKLLKVLEDRAVRRLGSTRPEPVDVWILTATNEDLVTAVREHRFRQDLYHRLAVVTLPMPRLRDRGDDILLLAEHYLKRACADYGLGAKSLLPDARAALLAHTWPGNVRELGNVMERVALLTEATLVSAEMLGLPDAREAPAPSTVAVVDTAPRLADTLGRLERTQLVEALQRTGGNVTRAAAALSISRDTLRYRMAKHGLARDGGDPSGAGPDRDRGRRAGDASSAPPAPAPPVASAGARSVGPAGETPGAGAVRWERRRLVFLRCVLSVPDEGDPRLYPSRAIEVLVDKIQNFGGRIDELGPTGIVGVFGLEPVEDAPLRAALAGAAIQKAAERAGAGDRIVVRSTICVRPVLVGLARGGAQIDLDGKREALAVLDALTAISAPSTTLVDEIAASFLDRHFELVPLAPAGQVRAFRLAVGESPRPGVGRRLPTFVGRRREIELLRSRLEDAVRGHGQVVGILGEAGIGKSRLLHELRQGLLGAPERRVTYLEGRCQSYASAIPYFPVLDILRQNFRLAESDRPEIVAEKVRAGLQEVGMAPDDAAPYLLHLLGVPAATERLAALTTTAIKVRTFEILRQLILNGARRRPIVLVVEDLQWVDSTSEECITSLMDSAAGAAAMAIVTYRPGHRASWMDRSYVTQVALQPLSREDSLAVVRAVRRTEDLSGDLVEAILAKAEGNPFFLEELARAVEPGRELAVPDTIQEVLLARIDRLPDEPKRFLQTAAVVGPDVPLPLVRAVWDGDPDPHLRELVHLEFLYTKSGGAEPVYAFTHTLTRDVAYETLPPARRRALHAITAEALEAVYGHRLAEVYDRLAYHYARTDRTDRAVLYLTRLAEKAARGHAHTEAVRILEEALGHVERLPGPEQDQRRLELAIAAAYSFIPLGRFEETINLLLRHQAALERLADARVSGPYHLLIGRCYLFLGQEAEGSRHASLGLAEASRGGDNATLGKIHYVLAQAGAMSGRPREGLQHGEEALRCLTAAGEQWWIGPAHWAIGLNHALLGQLEAALEAEARARATGEAMGDPQVQSSADWATGIVHTLYGDGDAGVRWCEQALASSPDPVNTAFALGWLGFAHLEQGDVARAVGPLEKAIHLLGQSRFVEGQGLFTVMLAEAHRVARRLETALEMASQALEMARSASSIQVVGWAERALGRIAQDRGALADATEHLHEALGAFTRVEAEYFVACTHLDLAAVARIHGDRATATHHVREARARFAVLRVPRWLEKTNALAQSLG